MPVPLILTAWLLLAAATTPAAPLPDRISPSTQAAARGLYAESRYGRVDINEQVAQLEQDCTARGTTAQIEGKALLWDGRKRLYRTTDRIAVWEDDPAVVIDAAACTARVSLVRSVKVTPASKDHLIAAGWLEQRPQCARGRSIMRRCTDDVVAGVHATCINLGDGLVGSSLCYSTQDDLSRDLSVGGSNYTDDGSGPDNTWGLDRVIPNALIDPVVFTAP